MTANLNLQHKTLLVQMEDSLNELAMMWRGTKNAKDEPEIVRRYQAILNCMVELGFNQSLDVELPDKFMPSAYLDF